MKVFYHILILLLTAQLFSGCGNNLQHRKEKIQITDMLGRKVEVPKDVHKVVGVRAGALRMLTYLDASQMVTGVEEVERRFRNPYNIAHPELTRLPLIGPQHGGDAELIVMSQPDVIFITYATVGEADDLQKLTGIPVVAINCGDIGRDRETFFSALRLMAKVMHKEDRADSLILYTERSIEDLSHRTLKSSSIYNPSVYVGGISMKGTHGIASTCPEFAPFEFIHAHSPASRLSSSNNTVTLDKEQLIQWNPEILFIDYAGWPIVGNELKQPALHESLDAVREKKVFMLFPHNGYATNVASVLVNSYYAGSVIFPEQFADISIQAKANEIYTVFLGRPVYKDMEKYFGGLKQVSF